MKTLAALRKLGFRTRVHSGKGVTATLWRDNKLYVITGISDSEYLGFGCSSPTQHSVLIGSTIAGSFDEAAIYVTDLIYRDRDV